MTVEKLVSKDTSMVHEIRVSHTFLEKYYLCIEEIGGLPIS